MRRGALVVTIAASVLCLGAWTTRSAAAAKIAAAPAMTGNLGHLQHTAVVCGFWGCTPDWRRWGYWGPHYSHGYPPACPYHYRYDCRYGPYGRPQCACWPWY